MKQASSSHLGPERTPQALKYLILATGGFSLFTALISGFFPGMGHFSLQAIFGLSTWGIGHGFIWQFFTYLFVFQNGQGISFVYLIHLAFNLYILWLIGASLIERSSSTLFLILYFLSGIISGVVAYVFMKMFGTYGIFSGNTPVIYAILVAWMILNPRANLLLFFTIPIQSRWLILGIFGANLLIDLSRGDFITFFSYLSAGLTGYFFALIAWRFHSPFSFLNRFEARILNLVERLRNRQPSSKKRFEKTKIYDFKTGAPMKDDDEKFMDEMLEKISKEGEGSLTDKERKRMSEISKKKHNP